jgi:hypothetical protein
MIGMSKKYVLFVVPFCMALLVLQSCWKDKSLKNKGPDEVEMRVDISPAFGLPLLNLTLSGGDIVKQFNLSDSSANYYVEYDETGLCIIVYDKTNSRLSLPVVVPFDTMVTFPINYFSDLRLEGLSVKQAFVNLNIDNGYTEDIHFSVNKLDYEDNNGNSKAVTVNSSSLHNTNVIKAAIADGRSARTQLFSDYLTIDDPLDIVKYGTQLHLGFALHYDTLRNGGYLNLNPTVRVPAWFAVENFLRRDTSKVNLSALTDIFSDTMLSLQSATLYLTINNGLPVETNLQLYFADENYRILDSLQSEKMQIRAGQTHPTTYLLINPSSASFEITMSKRRFEKIKTAKHIILEENFKTYGSGDVKLFKTNTLGIILSAKASANIDRTISTTTE